MQKLEKQYHIHCVEGDVGRYVLLPGDPGRCEKIAALFDDAHFVAQNREYVIYTGTPVSYTHLGAGTALAAVDLLGEPRQLRRRADLVGAVRRAAAGGLLGRGAVPLGGGFDTVIGEPEGCLCAFYHGLELGFVVCQRFVQRGFVGAGSQSVLPLLKRGGQRGEGFGDRRLGVSVQVMPDRRAFAVEGEQLLAVSGVIEGGIVASTPKLLQSVLFLLFKGFLLLFCGDGVHLLQGGFGEGGQLGNFLFAVSSNLFGSFALQLRELA